MKEAYEAVVEAASAEGLEIPDYDVAREKIKRLIEKNRESGQKNNA